MENSDKILENPRMRQRPLTVPEGYFASLESRLARIPSESAPYESLRQAPPFWQKVRPYMAMAAAFAAIVIGGTTLLRLGTPAPDLDSEVIQIAGIVPYTSPYSIYASDALGQMDEISAEDYEEYLIATGVSAEHIAYTAYYEDNR